MPRKHNRTGRRKGDGRFVALPHALLRSAAWQSLKPAERATYIEAAMPYDGSNNGFLAVSARRVADRLGISKSSAARALRALVEKGFLEVTCESAFNMKQRRATEYRLTLFKCDRTHALPSQAFQRWRPDENQNTVPSQAA